MLVIKGFYYFSLLPVLLAVMMIAFLRLDTYLLLIVFFTPLSVPLSEFTDKTGFDMWMPTEPMLAGLLLLFIFKLLHGEKPDKKFLAHPVSIAIYINLAWILITSLSSTMIVVSLKFLLARLWFVVPFYFIAGEVFKRQKNINKYLWSYIIPLLAVIAYSITRHISIGLFQQQAAHSVMNPFYTDHTSYGAILAMMIPVAVGFIFNNSNKTIVRILSFLVLSVLSVAIVLSYTRAAWTSVLGALGILLILMMRLRFTTAIFIALIAGFYLYSQSDEISDKIEKNRKESSANLTEHMQSISNVTSDASNLERINRWNCAIRMFRKKPLLGWGPGTYMFQYAPFQIAREKTIISTNMADKGNAHSEYLGPLSESGIPGMLSFLIIIITTIYTGIRVFSNAKEKAVRVIAVSVLLGLITYYAHGIVNNFLDTDKASAPFWGFSAILVILDIYYTGRKKENQAKEDSISV